MPAFFSTPRGLGLATPTTSAAFFPHLEQRIRGAESQEGKKIGETLFLILERLNDMQKPIWLAKVYAAYLADELKSSDLRRLASAIDVAFGDDLIELINSPAEMSPTDCEPWKKNLAAFGLTNVEMLTTPGSSRSLYHVSEWGRMGSFVSAACALRGALLPHLPPVFPRRGQAGILS